MVGMSFLMVLIRVVGLVDWKLLLRVIRVLDGFCV